MYLSEFREHLIGSDVLLGSIKLDSLIVALTVGVERVAPNTNILTLFSVCVETKFAENKWLNDVVAKFASELASIFSDMVQTGFWWKNIKKYISKHLLQPR